MAEKVKLLGSFLDRETGRSYYPGVVEVGKDIPAETVQRALNDGLAEPVDNEDSDQDE
jgi:hypothetical protein